MARVLVTRPLTEGGTDPLLQAGHQVVEPEGGHPPSPVELMALAADCDGMVCHLTDRIDQPLLECGAAGRLRVVANAAVGYDNIDVPAAQRAGVPVSMSAVIRRAIRRDLLDDSRTEPRAAA